MEKIIYIIRHAETDLNKRGIVQGRGMNTDINEFGRLQAEAFYEAYKDVPFDKIYTSTLKRTHQTIQKFIDKGIPWTQYAGLDEMAWGIYEGQESTEDVRVAYDSMMNSWSAGDLHLKFDRGESPLEVKERQLEVLEKLIEGNDAETILICMHGRAMRLFLCLLTDRPLYDMDKFPHTNTTLYKVKYDGEKFEILEFNNTAHLKDLVSKIRVSAVSYTNTKPFAYGLKHAGPFLDQIELSYDIPSDCAAKLIDNKADIGLVPVAALLHIPDYHIISDYCIGAVGPVNSVFIFSEKPVEEIRTVRLDKQSRTSNNLAKVLFKYYWNINAEFVEEGETDAFVEIGDRTFGKKEKFPFVYDMAEEWIKFTGLPFAFAVWASNKPLDSEFIAEFNKILKFGIDHREEVIKELEPRSDFDLHDYLMHRIDYPLTAGKRKAINKFLDLVKSL